MTLANCRRCGALYQRVSADICQKCYHDEERQIQTIREFQRRNPSATMMDVLKNIDIDHVLLEKWIDENRLQIVDNHNEEHKCRECGREVQAGEKLCRSCMYKKISPSKKETLSDSQNSNRGMFIKRPR